ncbi:hypothetical protein Pfo_018285 [Paulownia fortunei]|nr:hypothetical protein Pfo_018285 [Paulownia fortunei]
MSWLNLKRLLPPKKVWKVLTNKLPLKLHRLSRSKAKKKSKNRSYKTSKKLGWPSLSIQPKKFKIKPNPHTLIHHQNLQYYFRKRPPPVFVDQLFIEPVSVVKEDVHPPVVEVGGGARKEKSCSLSRPESSKEDRIVSDDHNTSTADDMWESMVMASPQMHGINERAEEFIARFRAEMHHQEMLARRL